MTLISIGFRNAIFSGFASYDYAELSHFDMTDNGATIGVRCSEGVDDRPYRYNFVHPTVSCEGLMGIIVTQPFGTMTSWLASRCEHTSSIDPIEFYDMSQSPSREPSIGVVAAQQAKLLSGASRNEGQTNEIVWWQPFHS